MGKEKLLAHVRQDANGEWQIHSLDEHLQGTAALAKQFASVFGLEK